MTISPDEPTDADLIEAVRNGQIAAYGQLYERHVGAARNLARQLTQSAAEHDDLVSEAFTKVLDTLRTGGGPDSAFRAYLLTTLRNCMYDRLRREKRVEYSDDMGRHDPGVPFEDTALKGLEASLVSQAFASLPERWQVVLWHTEVDKESPADIAPILGLTPNGVSALAYRAREGLRQAYLQMHLQKGVASQCESTLDKMGAWTRSGLSKRDRSQVDKHLNECDSCRLLAAELMDVNSGLRGIVAPIVVGIPFVAGYLGLTATKATAAAMVAGGAAAAGGNAAAQGTSHGGAAVAGKGSAVQNVLKTPGGQAGVAAAVAVVAGTVLAIVLTGGEDHEPQAAPPPSTSVISPGEVTTPSSAPPPQTPQPTKSPTSPTPSKSAAPTTTPPATSTTPDPTETPMATPKPPPPPTTLQVSQAISLGPLIAGQNTFVTVPVSNTGNNPATDVTAELSLPGGITAAQTVSANSTTPQRFAASAATAPQSQAPTKAADSGDWSCTATKNGVKCLLRTLPAGEKSTLYIPVAVAPNALSGLITGKITANNGQVSAAFPETQLTIHKGLTSPAPVYANQLRGRIITAGNTVLTCDEKKPDCRKAISRTGKRQDNNSWDMRRFNSDHSATTSSQADLAISANSTVKWAGLFWGGQTPKKGRLDQVRIRPMGGKYQSVIAAHNNVARIANKYQSYADVTSVVQTHHNARTWEIADVAAETGHGAYAGWSLFVAVADPAVTKPQQIAVFTDLRAIDRESTTSAELNVPWVAKSSHATVDLVAWETDNSLTGEKLSLDGVPLTKVSPPAKADNPFNGSAIGAKQVVDHKTVTNPQTFGVDVARFTARVRSSKVDGQERSILAASTRGKTGDTFLIGALGVTAPIK